MSILTIKLYFLFIFYKFVKFSINSYTINQNFKFKSFRSLKLRIYAAMLIFLRGVVVILTITNNRNMLCVSIMCNVHYLLK